MVERRRWETVGAWALFLASRGIALVLALVDLSHHAGISVQAPWSGYADAMRHGQLPYRDFDVLYPPGVLFLSWVLSVLPASAFHSAVIVVVFGAEVGAFTLLRKIDGAGWFTPSWAYILIGAIAPLEFIQYYGRGAFYESIPAFFVLLALGLLRKPGAKREVASLAALAAGILLKTYPIVIAPFMLVYLAQQRETWWARALDPRPCLRRCSCSRSLHCAH